MSSTPDSTLDSTTVIRGGAAGAVAFLLGYLITYAWQAPAVQKSLSGINAIAELIGAQAIPTWKGVGWLFFNAHVVATRVPALGGGDRMVNFISTSDDGALMALYVLVPALLVLAGAAVARYGHADRPANGAAAGVTVVVGYLPLAVVGAFAVGHTFGEGISVSPDPVTAVALAGLVYPAFFGAVGGAAGQWLGSATRN